ncbi:hypothetical protein AV545_22655 [Paenibacillus jamilae]|uniref:hypothetical protein n=1 Tax=Paenibacillus jamilae TaxID=114136 RepID=UPI0007AB4BCD|nr:hypothetical protein [Paenibacillus jamilae]KZE67900.1 hypothetical protein AV545_22655 [Paenibacillus jamilae]
MSHPKMFINLLEYEIQSYQENRTSGALTVEEQQEYNRMNNIRNKLIKGKDLTEDDSYDLYSHISYRCNNEVLEKFIFKFITKESFNRKQAEWKKRNTLNLDDFFG